jgi:tetratricopeptide (TPR) repeat protein
MRKYLVLLSLILIFLPGRSQDNTSRLAFEYYSQKEYDKAAPLFLKMYEERQVSSYMSYFANCMIQTDDFDTAIKTIKKAIRQNRDENLNILLGYVYEQQGDTRRSEEAFQAPMKEFPQTQNGIITLGNTYSSYAKYQYAENVYLIGRKLLGNPDLFHLELANIYYAQRRFPDMLNEYFDLLLVDPKYLPTVEAMIQNALSNDIDQTLLQMTHDKTFAYIQKWPGIPTFTEMLVWVLITEKKFGEAVDQAIAMDRRHQSAPDRLLQIARTASDAGDLDATLKAYKYLISKGPDSQSPPTVYNIARVEYLAASEDQLLASKETTREQWIRLTDECRDAIADLNKTSYADPVYLELAHILAFQLGNYEEALKTIETALALPGRQPIYRTHCLLEKADILLSSGDPWEASLVYSMVDMENPDNPEGSAARFKKAELSWFTGNYKWALAQLEILKGSTSKPDANNAMELSILIRENISETDSTQATLQQLARADYLIFRHKYSDAVVTLDSILNGKPDDPAIDDCLYKKAHILLDENRLDEAMQILQTITDKYHYEYWGHKALYELGCIYQDQKNEPAKAEEIFGQFIRDFPSSFYFLDAVSRLKELKSREKK